MDKPEGPTTAQPPSGAAMGQDLPAGNHPLEIAARRGFGPLSPLARQVWHGQAVPCVSCGQLVSRDARSCEHCGQDLTPRMMEKMRAHAGPWFVLEHLRPFPGVKLDRIVRQIHRGLLTEVSIVRGPATDFQWRFAVETPGLCRYFGRCWSCHNQVSPSDSYCPSCLTYLTFEKPRSPAMAQPATADLHRKDQPAAPSRGQGAPPAPFDRDQSSSGTKTRAEGNEKRGPTSTAMDKREHARRETMGMSRRDVTLGAPEPPQPPCGDLDMLRAALEQAPVPEHDMADDGPPRILGIPAAWIAGSLLIAALLVLLWVAHDRATSPDLPPAPTPHLARPAPPDTP